VGIQVDAYQLVWPPESSGDLKLVAPVAATQAQKPGPLKLLCLNGYFVREASAEQTLVEIVVVEGPRLVSVDSPFFQVIRDRNGRIVFDFLGNEVLIRGTPCQVDIYAGRRRNQVAGIDIELMHPKAPP